MEKLSHFGSTNVYHRKGYQILELKIEYLKFITVKIWAIECVK